METKGLGNAALVDWRSTSRSLWRSGWRIYFACLFASFLGLLVTQPAWAAEFPVTTTLDGADSDLTDGLCLNVTVVAGGACTLRAAIQQANSSPLTPDTIILPAGTYTLTLENALDNAEDASATGDLDVTTNIVINGAGAKTTIIAAKADLHDRVMHLVGDDAVLGLNGVTVRNGNTTDLNSGTRDGGGILVGGGKLQAVDLVVANSTSPTFGGGILFVGVNSSSLSRCTIHGNAATTAGGRGGGIFHGQNYVLDLANCTISDNEAGSRGGGLDVSNNSNLITILNTTIADNRLLEDPEEGAGVYIGNSTEINIYSSVIADNFAQGNVANDCYGQIDVLDFSLVEAPAPLGACAIAGGGESVSSLFVSVDPLLGPLADNGGTLPTHALLPGSVAIDAGSQLAVGSGGRACLATDARGEPRPSGAFCDMGAYEFQQQPALTIVKAADKSAVTAAGQTINYTITVTNTGNVSLTSVVLTDTFATATLVSGDGNGNNILETTETWVYNASHVVTQAEMDAGTALVNVAIVDTAQTAPQQDDATTTITSPEVSEDLYMPMLGR